MSEVRCPICGEPMESKTVTRTALDGRVYVRVKRKCKKCGVTSYGKEEER